MNTIIATSTVKAENDTLLLDQINISEIEYNRIDVNTTNSIDCR